MSTGIDVVYVSERLRGTLSPLRQRVLTELREPASATMIAERLGESRQRINYHLRELEKGGLVELVEERQRRGRVERIMRAVASAVIVAPELIGDAGPTTRDRFAADTLLAATARTFTDVALASSTGRLVTTKVATTPGDPREGVAAGLADVLDRCGVAPGAVGRVVHGTTLATNVILERRGGRFR